MLDDDLVQLPVATHNDATDVEQTVYFPSLGTLVATAADTGAVATFAAADTALVDVVSYDGLAPGEYRAEMVLQERSADGVCTATTTTAQTDFVVAGPSGRIEVGPFTVPETGKGYVAYESVIRVVESPNGDVVETTVAEHVDCDDVNQTVAAPAFTSNVVRSEVGVDGSIGDVLNVSGFVSGLPTDATAAIEIGVHKHSTSTPTAERACTASNRVTTTTMTVEGNGRYVSPGESVVVDPKVSAVWSYSNRLVVTFADGSRWEGDWHGCDVASESFGFAPSGTTPSGNDHRRRLPTTGSDSTMLLVRLSGLVMFAGVALVGVSLRRRRVTV